MRSLRQLSGVEWETSGGSSAKSSRDALYVGRSLFCDVVMV